MSRHCPLRKGGANNNGGVKLGREEKEKVPRLHDNLNRFSMKKKTQRGRFLLWQVRKKGGGRNAVDDWGIQKKGGREQSHFFDSQLL